MHSRNLNKNLYILHNSEQPATVFSVLESNNKGPRFEIGDFLVKLGSVTVGGVFKGVLVEVEYCPCVIVNNCWGILQEFMQGFLGSCVNNIPPQYFNNKGGETFTPVDTIQQYLEHFNIFRKTAGVR